jgi:gluconolactonase
VQKLSVKRIGACAALALLALLAGAAGRANGLVAIVPDAHYPEGPLWHGGKLYFAEMTRDRIAEWNGSAPRSFWSLKGCGPTSVAPAPGGLFLVTCHLGEAVVWVRDTGRTAEIITTGAGGEPVRNANDSAADGRGGVYFSSSGRFAPGAAATGAVYYIVPGGAPKRVAEHIYYANGVVVGPQHRFLYVSAHLARQVLRFQIGRNGALSGRETWLRLADVVKRDPAAGPLAGPDGLAMDSKGNLFIAEYGAGRIIVVGQDRKLKTIIAVPNRFTTSVEFGPGEREVFITAPAQIERWPYNGAVFKLANPVR